MKLRHLLGPRCTRARTLGSARLDGPLTELEQAEVDRHLRECADCRQVVAEMAELAYAVRSVPLTAAPAPVRAAPTSAPVARSSSSRRRWGSLAGVAAAAAVAAALGAAVATPWHRTPPRPAAPRSIGVIAQRFDMHHPWPMSSSQKISEDGVPPMRGAGR
jgi:anti-sigma factor RsiW